MRAAFAWWLAVALDPCAAAEAPHIAILDKLQAQFSACAAFYTIAQTCVGSADAQRRLAQVVKRADALALAIAMSPVDAALRQKLNGAADWSLMQDECGGFATLERRYAMECDPLSSGRE